MTKPEFILDGVTLPPPAKNGFSFTAETIWSQNAGRSTSTGAMVGDIIAVKYTVTLSFDRLTADEFRTIWSLIAVTNPFHVLRFPLPQANRVETKAINCYIAPPSAQMQAWYASEREGYFGGLTIECIEK